MFDDRIAIGTAQFGQPYGIANKKLEEVSQLEVANILKYALSKGIGTIDTAMTYGNSEIKLGNCGVSNFQIITKLPSVPKDCLGIESWIESQFFDSLSRLKVNEIYGLLLHNSSDLLGRQGSLIWSYLQNLKEKKIVKKIGYSIYNPEELDHLFELFSPDIIQAPYNIIDRRLSTSGWLDRLFSADVEIHIRSIFLQGLLLFHKNDRPNYFANWPDVFNRLDEWLEKNSLSAFEASISFALSDSRINKVIFGVNNVIQLREIVSNAGVIVSDFPEELNSNDLNLINPSMWTK